MNDLQVIKHKNERVLLTSQLAEVYETDVKNIQMNFKRNENMIFVLERKKIGKKIKQVPVIRYKKDK